ncbi:DMT family transporter [Bacteroidota bacterium]
MTVTVKDNLHLHFLVILWGFTAILGLLISVPAVELVFLRTLVASLGLLLILNFRKTSLNVGKRNRISYLGTGIIIAVHWMLFFGSARLSTASVCLAGMATTSFWTSLLEPLSKKRRPEMLEVFLGLLVILGLYLIFRFEFNHALGLVLALASAFLAATFTVINSRLSHTGSEYVISFYELTGACLFTLMYLLISYMFWEGNHVSNIHPTTMDWIYIFILALACTVYPFTASIELMKRLSAFTVNLTINLEPVYGIVLAVIIFGDREKMSSGFYGGAILILISVIFYPIIKKWQHKRRLRLKSL